LHNYNDFDETFCLKRHQEPFNGKILVLHYAFQHPTTELRVYNLQSHTTVLSPKNGLQEILVDLQGIYFCTLKIWFTLPLKQIFLMRYKISSASPSMNAWFIVLCIQFCINISQVECSCTSRPTTNTNLLLHLCFESACFNKWKISLHKTLDTSKLTVHSLFYPLVSLMEACPLLFLLILSAIKYIAQQRCLHIETKLCVNQLSERSGPSKYLAVGIVYFIYILRVVPLFICLPKHLYIVQFLAIG